MNYFKTIINGIIKENPTFVLLLGMCPTLATTTSAVNGLGMGVATMFVLICSNTFISLLKNLIPDGVRIPCYIVVIASFVTLLQMLMQAYVALTILGFVRELLGNGAVFGHQILPESMKMLVFVLAPGAFITLGLLMAIVNSVKNRKA